MQQQQLYLHRNMTEYKINKRMKKKEKIETKMQNIKWSQVKWLQVFTK